MTMTDPVQTPRRVRGIYHDKFWESVAERKMCLQKCRKCGTFRYPAGPACPACVGFDYDWEPVSGKGTVLSWVTYHRQYLPAYPAPYQVIAVRLDEGPIFVSNMEDPAPAPRKAGERVEIVYVEMPDGVVLPRLKSLS